MIDRNRGTRTGYAIPVLLLAGSALLAGAIPQAPLGAQEIVDEGTFDLFVAGQVVGSESFTIGRIGTGAGAAYVTRADITVEVGGQRLVILPQQRVMVEGLTPTDYELEISGSESLTVELRRQGQRFAFGRESDAGREEGEFRAFPGSLLLDDWIAHQYYFLGLQQVSDELEVRVIRARDGEALNGTSRVVARESASVGGMELPARKIELSIDSESHHVWVDDEGRVLRLEIPHLQLVAERASPPA